MEISEEVYIYICYDNFNYSNYMHVRAVKIGTESLYLEPVIEK
jgi:hypothetical protein